MMDTTTNEDHQLWSEHSFLRDQSKAGCTCGWSWTGKLPKHLPEIEAVVAKHDAYVLAQQLPPFRTLLSEVVAERERAQGLHGDQSELPDGTLFSDRPSRSRWTLNAADQKDRVEERAAAKQLGWSDILVEEVAEALEETDPAELRIELIQVAQVALSWAYAIDTRKGGDDQ